MIICEHLQYICKYPRNYILHVSDIPALKPVCGQLTLKVLVTTVDALGHFETG